MFRIALRSDSKMNDNQARAERLKCTNKNKWVRESIAHHQMEN